VLEALTGFKEPSIVHKLVQTLARRRAGAEARPSEMPTYT